jgi:hypothetical protein
MPQAIALVNHVLEHLNTTYGTQFGAGVQVGGDPAVIGITNGFETLAEYDTLLAALPGDQDYQAAVQMGDHLFADGAEDAIWKVRIPPGEPDQISQISHVRVELTRIAEAMTFAAEVSATVSEILGRPTGLVSAATGDRARILWVGYGSSLAQLEADGDTLEGNDEYVDLFKRSEGLFVPNTLEQNIWRRVTA